MGYFYSKTPAAWLHLTPHTADTSHLIRQNAAGTSHPPRNPPFVVFALDLPSVSLDPQRLWEWVTSYDHLDFSPTPQSSI